MRKYLMIAAVLALGTTAASAQHQNTPAQSRPDNPAVNTTGTSDSGASSLNDGQVKRLIEESGFSHVSELRKDENGIWRGKAMKDGKSINVGLDLQGNVIVR
jgi:hypothetical protein